MKSKIEWTDAVWNPVTGCQKVSEGCRNCYAERVAVRFWKDRNFTGVKTHPERLNQPLHWRKPRRIFVNSMSDLFHENVPPGFINDVWNVMYECYWNTFQILTKRPERMLKYCTDKGNGSILPLKNVWLGVSVEDQKTADERIPLLLQTPAAVRFVSAEPLLGSINFSKVPGFNKCGSIGHELIHNFWVICGGESGRGARPMHPDWARTLRDQCNAVGVPFFFKQHGEYLHFSQVPKIGFPKGACGVLVGGEFYKCGKARSGRILDGRTWDEFPK